MASMAAVTIEGEAADMGYPPNYAASPNPKFFKAEAIFEPAAQNCLSLRIYDPQAIYRFHIANSA